MSVPYEVSTNKSTDVMETSKDATIEDGPIDLAKSYPPRFKTNRFEHEWMPLEFYVEYPGELLRELLCFLRGHKMERDGLYQTVDQGGPVGRYCCTRCGSVLDLAMKPDELRRYAKHGFIGKLIPLEGEEE